MTVREWLSFQPKQIQTEVWKRLTAFLSTRELEQVMAKVRQGETIWQAHERLGLVDKYQLELSKIVDVLRKYN